MSSDPFGTFTPADLGIDPSVLSGAPDMTDTTDATSLNFPSFGSAVASALAAVASPVASFFGAQTTLAQNSNARVMMRGPAGAGFPMLGMGIASNPIVGTQNYGVPGGMIGPPTPAQAARTPGYFTGGSPAGQGFGALAGGLLGDLVGGPVGGALGAVGGEMVGNYFSEPGAAGAGGGAMMPGPYTGGVRRVSMFVTTDPVTGATVAVRKLGRPVLWSGDLAAYKRVMRVARKVSRFVHHRYSRGGRRRFR